MMSYATRCAFNSSLPAVAFSPPSFTFSFWLSIFGPFYALLALRDVFFLGPLHPILHSRRWWDLHKVHHEPTKSPQSMHAFHIDLPDLIIENVGAPFLLFCRDSSSPGGARIHWLVGVLLTSHDGALHSVNPHSAMYFNPVLDRIFKAQRLPPARTAPRRDGYRGAGAVGGTCFPPGVAPIARGVASVSDARFSPWWFDTRPICRRARVLSLCSHLARASAIASGWTPPSTRRGSRLVRLFSPCAEEEADRHHEEGDDLGRSSSSPPSGAPMPARRRGREHQVEQLFMLASAGVHDARLVKHAGGRRARARWSAAVGAVGGGGRGAAMPAARAP